MKKVIIILAILTMTVFTGCSLNKDETSDEDNSSDTNMSEEEMQKRKSDYQNENGGQRPEGFSKPEDGSMPEGFSRPEGGSMPEDGSMPEGFSRPEGAPQGKGKSGIKEFDDSTVIGQVTEITGNEVTITVGKITDNQFEATDETQTLLIPSALQIGNGNFTSIAKGNIIAISYDDEQNISAVSIVTI